MTKEKALSLTVNGVLHTIIVPEDTSLLEILRHHLGLTGTKHGCGDGVCGACAVIVDGTVKLACRVSARELDANRVDTVEGLAKGDRLHPLQRAFLMEGAVQCGFCTPGMLMASVALLRDNPRPSREDIRAALRGHICRCTGYLPIENAVLRASRHEGFPGEESPLGFGVGSTPLPVFGIEKVTGSARFTADILMPDAYFAVPVFSPVPSGTLKFVDSASVAHLPGIIRVLTGKDVPGENRLGRWKKDRPVIVEDRIRYVGDVLALIVAEDERCAREAAAVLAFEIEEDKGIFDITYDVPEKKHEVASRIRISRGRVPRETDNIIVEGHFSTSFIEHGVLEPESALAFFSDDGTMTVVGPSQNVFFDRREILDILGLSPREKDRVRVVQKFTGGAFGKREDMAAQPLAALACWVLQHPVRVVLTRRESIRMTTKRHPFHIRHRSVVSPDGELLHQAIRLVADTGAYSSWAPNILRKAAVHSTGPYEVKGVDISGISFYSNSAFSGAMRGFGATQAILAAEHHIHNIAGVLGMDPLELRLKWGFRPDSMTSTGQVLSESTGYLETLRVAAERFDWRLGRKSRAARGVLRGVGIAGAFYGIGYGHALPDKGQARLEIAGDGTVRVATGAIDYGQGAATIFRQIIVETLGAPSHAIQLVLSDTRETPDSGSTVASRQTYVTGNAVFNSCLRIQQRLLKAATILTGYSAENIRVSHDGWRCGDDEKISWKRLVECAMRHGIDLRAQGRYWNRTEKLDDRTGQGAVYRTYSFAAACAEVEIHESTARVSVRRVVSAHDSGRILHPVLAKGQVFGGVCMAAGMALFEEYRVKNGIPETLDFSTYRLPRFGDVPEIDIVFVEHPERGGPYGAKGLGEPAMLAALPAIVNAVSDALGKPVTRVPLTPHEIKRLLGSK